MDFPHLRILSSCFKDPSPTAFQVLSAVYPRAFAGTVQRGEGASHGPCWDGAWKGTANTARESQIWGFGIHSDWMFLGFFGSAPTYPVFSTSCVGFGFTSRTRGNRELLMKHPWFILDWWFQTALARRRGCYRSCHQPNKKRPSLPGTQGWWDQLVLVRNKCMVQQRSNNTHTYVYIYVVYSCNKDVCIILFCPGMSWVCSYAHLYVVTTELT